MSDKTVEINYKTCGSETCMVTYVDGIENGSVILGKNNKITFDNKLGADNPVSVYFYNENVVKDPDNLAANAISDFCKNKQSDPLVVTNNADCKMNKCASNYQYAVVGPTQHNTLDPVIIIEEGYMELSPPQIATISAVVGIVLGIVLGFLLSRWTQSRT